jgi:hypothetical protein
MEFQSEIDWCRRRGGMQAARHVEISFQRAQESYKRQLLKKKEPAEIRQLEDNLLVRIRDKGQAYFGGL